MEILLNFRKDGTVIGSIGVVNTNNLFIQGDSTNSGLQCGTNNILPLQNNANADNLIDLGLSNIRWKDLYLGGGAFIGGTGTANKLDDYEEGSWTPTITSSVTNPTITYDTWHHGNYTKIGDTVFARAFIRTDSVSGGSGDIYIDGFPFNFVAGTTGSVYPASVMITGMNGWSTTPSYAYNLYVDDRIQLYDSSGTAIPVSGLATGSNANQMMIFVMYKV